MRTELVVVPSPARHYFPSILQRHKPVHVQAFVPEAAIEGFDIRIVRRCAWTGIVEFDFVVVVRLGVQRPRDELRSVVDFDSLRQPAGCLYLSQHIAALLTFIDLSA